MAAPSAKIDAIRAHFGPLINQRLARYQTAELLLDDTWSSWPDLPIRLYTDAGLVGVSWSKFDDLWLSNHENLPFTPEDSIVRWVENYIEAINDCLGRRLHGVLLGRGQLKFGESEIEIWTRLLVDLGECWLEVFNALDENGYHFHTAPPDGEYVRCL